MTTCNIWAFCCHCWVCGVCQSHTHTTRNTLTSHNSEAHIHPNKAHNAHLSNPTNPHLHATLRHVIPHLLFFKPLIAWKTPVIQVPMLSGLGLGRCSFPVKNCFSLVNKQAIEKGFGSRASELPTLNVVTGVAAPVQP